MKISVIIPTFNGQHLLKVFLPSVTQTMNSGDELIIADDASTDKTSKWLINRFQLKKKKQTSTYQVWLGQWQVSSKSGSFKLIIASENVRFAKNSNQAVQQATGQYIFLVNNDVQLDSQVILNFQKEIRNLDHKTLFAVGCLEYEGSDRSARKGGKNRLWFEKGLFTHARDNNFATGSTAWASGGSAFFSRKKWLQLDGFDEQFAPAYWEDIDLSFRAKKHGWKVWFSEDCVVFHQHESTHTDVFGVEQMSQFSWKNADYFTRKHADLWQRLAYYLWRPYWLILRKKQMHS